MSVFELAFIGGLISAVSTSLGSFLSPIISSSKKLRSIHVSLDFSLGVMLSAVAFSLVGPELVRGNHFYLSLAGLITGTLFIYFVHYMIEYFTKGSKDSTKYLLIAALIFHNLPEGMGAGASLGAMRLSEAIPLQVAISVQNIMEGLLLTLLLQGLGLSMRASVIGGVASGLIEMTGALGAGLLLEQTQSYLPFLLTLAGGAMMMSVFQELREMIQSKKDIQIKNFILGLLTIPLTNMVFG